MLLFKKRLLIQNDVENGEGKEDDSDSEFETNMVRHYQWKRGDDGYLTKSMVEVDANKTWVCGSQWRKC